MLNTQCLSVPWVLLPYVQCCDEPVLTVWEVAWAPCRSRVSSASLQKRPRLTLEACWRAGRFHHQGILISGTSENVTLNSNCCIYTSSDTKAISMQFMCTDSSLLHPCLFWELLLSCSSCCLWLMRPGEAAWGGVMSYLHKLPHFSFSSL